MVLAFDRRLRADGGQRSMRTLRLGPWAWLIAGLAVVGCGGQFGSGAGTGGSGGTQSSGGNPGSGGGATGGFGASNTGGGAQGGGPATGGVGGGITVDYRACRLNSDCILRSASCCGACGEPTRADVTAINKATADAYAASVCDPGQACPACAGQVDPTLIATCQAGRCQVVDMATSPLTACSGDASCVPRVNTCCQCGATMATTTIISINHAMESQFAALVCDPNQACLDCMPQYPTAVSVQCSSGRCIAKWN